MRSLSGQDVWQFQVLRTACAMVQSVCIPLEVSSLKGNHHPRRSALDSEPIRRLQRPRSSGWMDPDQVWSDGSGRFWRIEADTWLPHIAQHVLREDWQCSSDQSCARNRPFRDIHRPFLSAAIRARIVVIVRSASEIRQRRIVARQLQNPIAIHVR